VALVEKELYYQGRYLVKEPNLSEEIFGILGNQSW